MIINYSLLVFLNVNSMFSVYLFLLFSMCRILKIRQNTASHSASAEYSAKLPNIRLRQPADDYSVHPYWLYELTFYIEISY